MKQNIFEYNTSLFNQFNRDMDRIELEWNKKNPMDKKGRRKLWKTKSRRQSSST